MFPQRKFPQGENVLSGRFIRAIKNVGNSDANYKARFVLQGHRDWDKRMFVHDSATLRHQSLRIVLSITAIYGLHAWYRDVTQASVEGKLLSPRVYLRPELSFGLADDQLLNIVRPLYGLSDDGDSWWATSREFLTSDHNFLHTTADPCLRYSRADRPALLGLYVDEIVFAGSPDL